MSFNVREISGEALRLPTRSRAMLADLLLDSLDEGETGTYETAWLELARQRDDELSRGSVEGQSHERIMKSAREALTCSR
jgi:hypothetical protein